MQYYLISGYSSTCAYKFVPPLYFYVRNERLITCTLIPRRGYVNSPGLQRSCYPGERRVFQTTLKGLCQAMLDVDRRNPFRVGDIHHNPRVALGSATLGC